DIIQDGRSVSRGTGFLVADGLALTALHVVADRRSEALAPYAGEIVLTFPQHESVRASIYEPFWDRRADWAILKCEDAPHVRPLPLGADLRSAGIEWQTYGFPDANPRDGMVTTGVVKNQSGELDGARVYQLFSQEAAAGGGAPVKGFSGAPVLVENAVVALLR